MKKWSWKSHGKIFCQVCGNPDCSVPGLVRGPLAHSVLTVLQYVILTPGPSTYHYDTGRDLTSSFEFAKIDRFGE